MALSAIESRFHEFEEGIAYLAAGQWAAAVDLLRAAARREPGRLAVVRALTTALLQLNDVEGAKRAVSELTRIAPMSANGWRLAAQLEWKLGQYDRALELVARGLEHLPNSKILQRQREVFWGARGKMEQPGNDLPASITDQIAKPEPDWLDRVAQDSGLLASVINAPAVTDDREMLKSLEFKLSALLEAQPHHADRQLNLARLQIKIGNSDAALLSVQRALRANQNYTEAHRLRATILAQMGELDSAIDVLEGLIKKGIDWADIHCQLAELQKQRGRADDARSHLYSAIRLNPDFERAKGLLERWAA